MKNMKNRHSAGANLAHSFDVNDRLLYQQHWHFCHYQQPPAFKWLAAVTEPFAEVHNDDASDQRSDLTARQAKATDTKKEEKFSKRGGTPPLKQPPAPIRRFELPNTINYCRRSQRHTTTNRFGESANITGKVCA